VLHERKSRFAGIGSKLPRAASDSDVAPMAPRVGADLRAARERLAWTIQDIAGVLRIRGQYLVALEEGRIDELPGVAYAVGFLRTYAITLGLDPDELTRRFRDEAEDVNRKIELIFPVPVPERGVPAGAVVFLGVVLAIGAYIGWYRLSGDGALPPEVVAPVPARLAPLAEQVTPRRAATPAPGSRSNGGSAGPMTTTQVMTAQVTTPDAAPANATAGAAPPPVTDTTAATEPVPSVPPSQAAAATTMPPLSMTPPPLSDQPRIVLSANADAWLLVRDKSGQVLLNRVLHPGETWSVPLMPNLTLTTGNAGGTNIMVDGTTAPPLGADGAVRRDIPLDPDLLKSGKQGLLTQAIVTASSGATVAPKAAPQ
jgi:cytoskeleton protein RodZ